MKKAIVITLFSLSVLTAFGQSKNFIDQPYLETNARVDSIVVPDLIYMDIILKEADTKNKVSVEELETKMTSTLKKLGINVKEDLRLKDMGSSYKSYLLKSKDVMKSKFYELKVSSGLMAGQVLVNLETIGISNINITRTEYSKMDELSLQLKSKAILKARQQAQALAQPLGQTVGGAIYISDRNFTSSYRSNNQYMALEVSADRSQNAKFKPQDLEFNGIKVSTEVTVRFKI